MFTNRTDAYNKKPHCMFITYEAHETFYPPSRKLGVVLKLVPNSLPAAPCRGREVWK